MSYAEALIEAHSTEATEAALVELIHKLLNVWDKIESLPDGSDDQKTQISKAQGLVEMLRNTYKLSSEEINDLDAAEFRQMFKPATEQSAQQEACGF